MTSPPDPCARCGAPLDDRQRYCVVCGESRRHPDDPAARYLRGRRAGAAAVPPAGVPVVAAVRRERADTRLVALALALLPVAAAAGVLVGRSGGSDDQAVLAALKASDARAARAAAAPAATATAVASVAPVTGDFSGTHGWIVRLKTLDATAAAAATPKGTGVLVTAGYTLKPAGKTAAYVLFAGPYRSRAAASKARRRLVERYPDAAVVEVRRAKAATAGATRAGGSRAARVAAEDAAAAKPPTAAQKAEGAKIVQQIQAKRGKSYVEQQQKLPDTIAVP
jgi:hypothetical protein